MAEVGREWDSSSSHLASEVRERGNAKDGMRTKIFVVIFGLVIAVVMEWDLFHLLRARLTWYPFHFGISVALFAAFAGLLWWMALYNKEEEQVTPYQVYWFLFLLSSVTYLVFRLNYERRSDLEILAIITVASHVSYLCPPLYAVAKPQ